MVEPTINCPADQIWIHLFQQCVERPVDITPPRDLSVPKDNAGLLPDDARIPAILATGSAFSTYDDFIRFQLALAYFNGRQGGPEGSEFSTNFNSFNEGWDYKQIAARFGAAFRVTGTDDHLLNFRIAPELEALFQQGNENTFGASKWAVLINGALILEWTKALPYFFNQVAVRGGVGGGRVVTITDGALLHDLSDGDGVALVRSYGAAFDVVRIPVGDEQAIVLAAEIKHSIFGNDLTVADLMAGGALRLDWDFQGKTTYLPYGVERCDAQKQRMDRIQRENRTFRTEITELTGNFDKFHQLLTDAPELSPEEKAAITAAFKAINPNLDIEHIKDLLDPTKMRDVNRSIYKVVLESQAREIEAAMIKEAQDAGRDEQDINENVRPTIASRLAALRLDTAGIDARVVERFPDDYNFWALYPDPYRTNLNKATCRDVDDTYSRLTGEHSQLSTNKEQIIRKLELLALIFGRVEKSERVVRGAAYSFANVRFQVNRPDGKTPQIFDDTFNRLKAERTDLNMASLKKDGREDRAALSAFTAAINSDLNDHWTEYIEASTQLKRMHAYVEKVRAGTLSFPVALDGKLDAEGKKTAKAFMTAFGGVYGNLAAEFVNQTHTAEVFSGKLSPDPASPLTAEELEEIKTKGIVIRAHTSGEANAVHNLHLSARRAIAAKLYLMAQGIPADRIKIYAFGELMPRFAEVGNKKTKDYFRELNRRIEYYFDDGSVPQFNIAPASIGGGAEAAPDVPEGTDAEDAPRDTRTPAQKAMAQANRAFQLATQAEKTLASNKPAALRLADRAIAAAQAVITANKDPDATTKADEALTKAQAAKAKAEAPAEAPVPD